MNSTYNRSLLFVNSRFIAVAGIAVRTHTDPENLMVGSFLPIAYSLFPAITSLFSGSI
ncbi:hypothetical protein PL11201_70009 [Planktothrix sp. PCC 11201]|nr:hypothetical protein PL11201_70009 [Planktothrix sp. PCC 11201]